MKPSRRSQPHRKGPARVMAPGSSLSAMLRGRSAFGQNVADQQRAGQKGLKQRLRAAKRR